MPAKRGKRGNIRVKKLGENKRYYCKKCQNPLLLVWTLPPGSEGGKNKSRTIMECPICQSWERIMLGGHVRLH